MFHGPGCCVRVAVRFSSHLFHLATEYLLFTSPGLPWRAGWHGARCRERWWGAFHPNFPSTRSSGRFPGLLGARLFFFCLLRLSAVTTFPSKPHSSQPLGNKHRQAGPHGRCEPSSASCIWSGARRAGRGACCSSRGGWVAAAGGPCAAACKPAAVAAAAASARGTTPAAPLCESATEGVGESPTSG